MDGIAVDVLNYMIYFETNEVNFFTETSFLYNKRFYHFVSRTLDSITQDKFILLMFI